MTPWRPLTAWFHAFVLPVLSSQPQIEVATPCKQTALPDYDVDDELERFCIPQFEVCASVHGALSVGLCRGHYLGS